MTNDDKLDWRTLPPWGVAAAFMIEAWFAMLGSYELAGGDSGGRKAEVMVLAGLIVAVMCAWAGKQALPLWRRPELRPIAWVMLAVATLGFVVAQVSGWRVMGVTLADGGLRREVKADSIASLRDELRQIGITRPIGTIEADHDLELRRTSKTFPKGDGPAATKLKGEMATARRKADLEQRIADAGTGGGIVKAGAENAITDRFGLSADKVQLFLICALCALVGFFANFGFALIEVLRGGLAAHEPRLDRAPYDPRALPPVPRQLAAPVEWQSPPPIDGGALWTGPQAPPSAGGGGGSTNIIHVNPSGQVSQARLPPRIAARRG